MAQNALYLWSNVRCSSHPVDPWKLSMDQTAWRKNTTSGGTMSQLALLPNGSPDWGDGQPESRLVRIPSQGEPPASLLARQDSCPSGPRRSALASSHVVSGR